MRRWLTLGILAAFLFLSMPPEAFAKGGRGSGGGRFYSPGSSYGRSYSVRPYVRRDGVYVPSHRRTVPDGNRWNNWSTRGNVNPYTGKPGTKNPY